MNTLDIIYTHVYVSDSGHGVCFVIYKDWLPFSVVSFKSVFAQPIGGIGKGTLSQWMHLFGIQTTVSR